MSHTSGTTVNSCSRAGDKTIDNASRDAKFEKNLADYKKRQAEEQSAAAKLRSDTLQAGQVQEKVTGKAMNFDDFFRGRRVIQPDEWNPATSGLTCKEESLTSTSIPVPSTSALAHVPTATPPLSMDARSAGVTITR